MRGIWIFIMFLLDGTIERSDGRLKSLNSLTVVYFYAIRSTVGSLTYDRRSMLEGYVLPSDGDGEYLITV
jgi:hypothetical protein